MRRCFSVSWIYFDFSRLFLGPLGRRLLVVFGKLIIPDLGSLWHSLHAESLLLLEPGLSASPSVPLGPDSARNFDSADSAGFISFRYSGYDCDKNI